MRVLTGREERARELIAEADGGRDLDEVFVPRTAVGVYDARSGRWGQSERVMFPGYLIVVARRAGAVAGVLEGSGAFARVLGDGTGPVPLSDEEIAFIDAYTKHGHRVVPVSRGRVEEGGRVVVTDGPLVGREALIVKVRHRKKRAVIRMSMCGREVEAEVGLHLVRGRRA